MTNDVNGFIVILLQGVKLPVMYNFRGFIMRLLQSAQKKREN